MLALTLVLIGSVVLAAAQSSRKNREDTATTIRSITIATTIAMIICGLIDFFNK